MANRRMFSLKIIDTDKFIDMPQSSQLLYFHLSMRADDDGFVNSPKKIQRIISCTDDDFKILLAKQYVIPFNSGVCVIKDWKIHNYIQKDRYQETIYIEEKQQLTEDSQGTYTKCIQDGYKMFPQVRDRIEIGKDRDRDRDKKDNKKIYSTESKKVLDYFNKRFNARYTTKGKGFKNILARISEGYTYEDCISVISKKEKDEFFINNPKYLNPETLFRPSNFEKYLNEFDQPAKQIKKSDIIFENGRKEFLSEIKQEQNSQKLLS